jgi:hypothetical protein
MRMYKTVLAHVSPYGPVRRDSARGLTTTSWMMTMCR